MMYALASFVFVVFAAANGQVMTKGKYNINLDDIKECPDYPAAKTPFKWTTVLSDYNSTDKAVSATVDLPVDFDEAIDVNVEVRLWTENKWKHNFVKVTKKHACQAMMDYFKSFAVKVLTDAGVPNPDRCPVPKGSYKLTDYIPHLHLIDMPFFYGKFMLIITSLKGSEVYGCGEIHFTVVE